MENMNELLYMVRMKDEWALEKIFSEMVIGLEAELSSLIKIYRPLNIYRDELKQEEMVSVIIAIENYRPERECSFQSYAAMIARRQMWHTLRKLNHQFISGFNSTLLLDDVMMDQNSFINLMISRDVLSNPVYRLEMREAEQRINETIDGMNNSEKQILNSWLTGRKFTEESKRLGLTYKQYESRLSRVRKKVHSALDN